MPPTSQLNVLTVAALLDVELFKSEVSTDPFLSKVLREIAADPESHPKYSVQHGTLNYKNRMVISGGSSLKSSTLHLYHNSIMGGHSGFLRTYKRITGELYWVGMKADVKKFVEECCVCQHNKSMTVSPVGLLQPLAIPMQIWEDITMDFVEGLPKSRGQNTIFVVVDRLSKYAHFIPLCHPFTAKTVVAAFVKEVVRLHGFPQSIISDRDKIFLSNFWTELFRLQGTKLKRSTSYHPQTDGQTEVVNRCLETYFHCFCGESPRTWESWLSWAEY